MIWQGLKLNSFLKNLFIQDLGFLFFGNLHFFSFEKIKEADFYFKDFKDIIEFVKSNINAKIEES